MAVKLHRCGSFGKWVRISAHPCWKVEKALRDEGIDYEPVYGPNSRRARTELEKLSGQRMYPVIQFEDGSVYREQSKDMAATIRAGKLDEKRGGDAGAAAPPPS
jgi:hypothetical protein